MMLYMIALPTGSLLSNALKGLIVACSFCVILYGFDKLFRRHNLKSFNIALIGLFIGYLMGQGLVLVFNSILAISFLSEYLNTHVVEMIRLSLFLFGTYLATIMTLRASDEFYISLPFIRFAPTSEKKKDLIVDASVLADPRIIDLAASGLLDHHLIIPRFLIKDLYAQAESFEEDLQIRSKRSLESLKKLEEFHALGLRYNETDFPEIKEQHNKLIRLARLLDANILTSDITRVEMASIEGIKIINLHNLSNALKPLMKTGEVIRIKVQRYGKEPRQGVGYLEDGTMVVINGGGDFIGEIIEAQVLSVKHTSSGRMIFCNVLEDNAELQPVTSYHE